MYKIGDFSKLSKASIRTLRYYDEIGLLKPDEIDVYTGYRYYSDSKLGEYQVIFELKSAGFSLEEIKANWNNFDDKLMLKKKQELLEEITDTREKIRKIDYLRSNIINRKIVFKRKSKEVEKIKRIVMEE